MSLTGTEKSRISRERAKLGLVRLDVWVPADKLEAIRDMVKAMAGGTAYISRIHEGQATITAEGGKMPEEFWEDLAIRGSAYVAGYGGPGKTTTLINKGETK